MGSILKMLPIFLGLRFVKFGLTAEQTISDGDVGQGPVSGKYRGHLSRHPT